MFIRKNKHIIRDKMKIGKSKNEDSELGECIHVINESKLVKFFIFIGGILMGTWVSYSYFFLGHVWVYGIFFAELPDIVILILSGVLLLVGISSLWSMRKRNDIQIYQNGLLINGEKVTYANVISMELKRRMFVSIIVRTLENEFIYTASIFTHKDQEAINQVMKRL
ncbi:hypothetical protein [Enterococcus sp. DIV0170]|uniref:hypothetical protein n=1 Tax=Enterococcus sp. DIV0170 TaxID=2774642 RepID=UPI003F2126FF